MYRIAVFACSFLLTAVTQAADNRPTLDTDPNLVGWWRFEETAGKTAMDSSGNGRNGSLKGPLSFSEDSTTGRVGRAIRLDGQDQYLEIGKYKGITGTRPRTVTAWIRTATARGEIIAWGTEDFGQMFVFGYIRGRVGITPRGGYLYMNRETNDDEWHHVAAVIAKAELPNLYDDATLYLDGAPAEIHDIGLLDLWPIQTGDELDVRIGRRFQGLLDELRLYDRALSAEEVQELFRLETTGNVTQAREGDNHEG